MFIENESSSLIRQIQPLLSTSLLTAVLLSCLALVPAMAQEAAAEEEGDLPEITNGERLFLETRFAQFFKVFLDAGGDVNEPLSEGDPILNKVSNWKLTPEEFAEGPFAGQSMNCRSCHFVDELGVEAPLLGYGMRTYSDFARRSPVPAREDGHTNTVRNAPPLVNASLPRDIFFLHFDAEFPTIVDLVKGTLTGRNYGYLPAEQEEAIAQIARIIREDDGTGDLAQEFGGLSYSVLLTGIDPTILPEFLLPEEFRLDVSLASDQEILHAVSRLIGVYTENLVFSQDGEGNFNLSPYDVFLELNNLPRQPQKWESNLSYSQRLLENIERLESGDHLFFPRGHFGKYKKHRNSPSNPALQFVESNPNTEDGRFQFHDQTFTFGEEALKGLKIFFAQKGHRLQPSDLAQGGIGNCIACHAAPNFTDFRFHNTGIAQQEYDRIHGDGAFAGLDIPGLIARNLKQDAFLPATPQHPNAQEPFRAIPKADSPQLTDLGVWNIFWNPDFLTSQLSIWQILCEDAIDGHLGFFHIIRTCQPDRLLPRAIALFKTPGLRDLGHSAPYTHSGINDTLEGVIRGYMRNSDLARQGALCNGAPALKEIALVEGDLAPLVAFLNAMNEDYE